MGPMMGGVPVVRYTTSSAVIVFDGNSLVLGASGATDPMPAQVFRNPPISSTSACTNSGTNGARTYEMTSQAAAQIDPLFNAAKDNILVVWEGRNSMYNGGRTPAQAWAEVQAYVSARLALHPEWKIVLMTVLPQRASTDTDASAAATWATFQEFNDLMRAGWRAAGAKALVDVVASGSPFLLTSFAIADFNAIGLWSPTETTQWVHLSNAGYAYIASLVSASLRRLRKR